MVTSIPFSVDWWCYDEFISHFIFSHNPLYQNQIHLIAPSVSGWERRALSQGDDGVEEIKIVRALLNNVASIKVNVCDLSSRGLIYIKLPEALKHHLGIFEA